MMQIMRLIAMLFVFILCTACSKSKEPQAPQSNVEPPPAISIAKESRAQLDKAKEVEKTVQQAADAHKQTIDAATNGVKDGDK
jgi:hypothetical protein